MQSHTQQITTYVLSDHFSVKPRNPHPLERSHNWWIKEALPLQNINIMYTLQLVHIQTTLSYNV